MPMISITTGTARDAEAQVFCPECSYHLEGWEVHLLKHPACTWCGADLELGVALELELAAD